MDLPLVIGIGEYLWDMLPEGKKAGGAPVNFAFHASRHGALGWAVSAVGNDALGDELVRIAEENGINLCVSREDFPTGTVKVTLADGIPNYEICEGVAWDHIHVTPQAAELAGKASAVCFGSLAQRSPGSRAAIRELVAMTPPDSLKVFDINLRQNYFDAGIVKESLHLCNVLKINDEELEALKSLLGYEGLGTDDVCFRLIRDYSLNMAIMTAGDKFSSVYSPEGVSTIATPRVEVVDTVGAGDAFAGSFVAAVLNGASIAEAHELAVGTAADVCMKQGAWV